jgi:hypothetical protein
MSGFTRASARRRRAGDDVVMATFAPFEVRLLRQFVHELVLLLQAEAGAGLEPDHADNDLDDEFDAITARSGLGGPDSDAPIAQPDDPVIARLFPDAYADDAEGAADFRRFTQHRLVDGKHTSAQAVLETLPAELDDDADVEIALDRTAALQWLGTLNDIRLALGVRLGVEQDDDEVWDALPDDDPRGTVHQIYQWLGWVQETLVASLPRPR